MGIAEVVPQLDNCCCGCQLRTGSKFAGWWGVILGLIGFTFFMMAAFGASILAEKGSSKLTPEQLQNAKVTSIIASVLCLLKVLFSILLLSGAYQEKLSYYLPWIIYATVALLLDIIALIMMIIQSKEGLTIFVTAIFICINCYFTLVVYSDYRRQKERGRRGYHTDSSF